MSRIPYSYPSNVLTDSDVGVTVAPASYVAAQLVQVTLTPGVEGAGAANAIDVVINVTDLAGNAVSRAQRLLCELVDASMVAALVAAWTLAEVGAGSEISTTARPALLIATDANGNATVRITDVSGVSTATMYLKVTPLPPSGTNMPGAPAIVSVTFA